MEKTVRTIDHLDKVGLKLTVTPAHDQHSSDAKVVETSLIFGIGVEGVTPFEKLLFAKPVGQNLTLSIENGCENELFGHLKPAILRLISHKPPFQLAVTILSIERAEGREVVKAMAGMAEGCGGGCDCGCGCG